MRTIVLATVLLLSACDPRTDSTLHTLEGAGYSQITLTGYRPFKCSEDDAFATGFTAKGPSGKPVSGTVCSSVMFKGSTIRLD